MTEGDNNMKKVDPTSPYFLGSQDNPGNIITHVQLRGDNFEEWQRAIRLALRARRKLGFVDGTIKKPTEADKLDDWLTVHSMVVSWLMQTIEPSLKSSISYYEDAQSLWEDLAERFAVVNGPHIHQLKAAIVDCKQTKTMPVVTYYGKLKVLWDELASYQPIPGCKCGKCMCNIGKELEVQREDERLHQFLMGLYDEYYGSVRSNLLSLDPLPTLNRAYQTLIQEERVRGISRGKEVRNDAHDTMTFAVRSDGRGHGRVEKVDRSGLYCTHCNRTGHDDASCFILVGYPDWWGDRPRGQISGAGRGVGRGTGKIIASVGAACGNTPTTTSVGSSTDTTTILSGLTQEQWKSLLDVFANKKNKDQMIGPNFEEADWSGWTTGWTLLFSGYTYSDCNEGGYQVVVGIVAQQIGSSFRESIEIATPS